MKNGPPQLGKIVGSNNGSVTIDLAAATGTVQTSINLGLVSHVFMPPPPGFQAGLAAYQTANWDKALADLKPVAEQFRGLPVEWAQQAAGLLGDIYIEKQDFGKAEAAYNDFRRLYPAGSGGQLRLNVAQARIAFGKKNVAAAKQQLQGIVQAALKNPALVTNAEGAAYGQAFYLLGQIQEQEHGYQDALESYLRTVTLFYQDAAVATRAQQSADQLRSAHKGLVVP